VRAEIVHDDDVAWLQRRHQQRLDIGTEALAVDRAIDDAGRVNPIVPERGEEGHGAPMAVRHASSERDTPPPPGVGANHVGLRPGLIDEDEARRIDLPLGVASTGPGARRCQGDPARSQTLFFEADALAFERTPERIAGHHDTAFTELPRQRVQGQIRLLSQPPQQPAALLLRQLRPSAAHGLGGRAARPARAATTSPRSQRPRCMARPPSGRLAARYRRHDTLTQIEKVGSRHPCWPPSPACSLNQNSPDLGPLSDSAKIGKTLRRPPSERSRTDEALSAKVRASFIGSERSYGARRVWHERQHGLKARPRRRRLPPDLGERQASAVAPNVLDRAFAVPAPHRRWIADFTYIWTAEGWLYVAAVVDLFSRRVVGWSMSAAMTAQLVTDTLVMAIWRRVKPDALMHHSDRGSQYTSEQFQRLRADIMASSAR